MSSEQNPPEGEVIPLPAFELEQVPMTDREHMHIESDMFAASEIRSKINKAAVLSSMQFTVPAQ